jgi:predicted nucleic acid-binding protein
MVVVDTTVWIDYIHGLETPYTNALDYELLHNQVITGDLLITEFLQGFRNDSDFDPMEKYLGLQVYKTDAF